MTVMGVRSLLLSAVSAMVCLRRVVEEASTLASTIVAEEERNPNK